MTVRTVARIGILGRATAAKRGASEKKSPAFRLGETRKATWRKSLEHAQVGDFRDVFDGFGAATGSCAAVVDLAHDARRQTWPLRTESGEDLREARHVSGQ